MWSSQRYLQEGRSKNRPIKLLTAAITQITRLRNRNPPLPAILTLGHLAKRTDVDFQILRDYVSRKVVTPYRKFSIRKRSGGLRRICVPSNDLMATQKWIEQFVLHELPVHHASHAFRRGSSIVRCAEQHCGARWLVKMDIADFFGSITEIQVYRIFRQLGYAPLVSFELARLCTDTPSSSSKYQFQNWKVAPRTHRIKAYASASLGRLPQGAPTSPMLANLAMVDLDGRIANAASAFGLVYTRYADDMTFSTKTEFSRAASAQVIQAVAAILKAQGLYLNKEKTSVIPPGARKVVLGLLVDGDVPCLSREFRDRIRQHLYYLEKFGVQAHVDARRFDSVGGYYRHLKGLIDYANMVDPHYAEGIMSRFKALPWPGS